MKVTPGELAEWVVLYQAGQSLRAIAEQAGRDHKIIGHAIKRAGIAIRRNQRTPAWYGWCDECCQDKPLNRRTGWCDACSSRFSPPHPNASSGTIRT